MNEQPSVLAIILNYNTYEMTLKIIDKLRNLNYSNLDILVVDNNSSNESVKELKKNTNTGRFKLIVNDTNGGYAVGNNIGLRFAVEHGYKYSWILNNDLIFDDSNILNVLITAAEADSKVACVGPRITDLNGNRVCPYISRPNLWSLTFGMLKDKHERHKYIMKSGIVYRVYGCCMLLKNSNMTEINYLDERTFLYCEEDILAERLLKIGCYSYYCADTSVVHLESMTVNREQGKKSLKKIKIVMSSMNIYLKEYLHYGILARKYCMFFRGVIMLLRG